MTIYIVAAREANETLAQAITQHYQDDHFRFSDRMWFIKGTDTAINTSERLGIRKEGITGAVVIAVSPLYYGVANPDLWEWLRISFEKSSEW